MIVLNMEFAFIYGIWEFLIQDLTTETHFLATIGYGTDLNFLCLRDQLHIIFDRKKCDLCFLKGFVWQNALNPYAAHPLKR